MIKTNFWAPDPDAAARLCAQLYPQTRGEALALADEICENRFTFRGHWEMERTHVPVAFPAEIDWAHVENGDPEWCFAFSRHSFFVTLGQAWRYTGDDKYPAAFARLAADWMARAPLTEASAATTWRPIEAGIRCENWLRALALFEGSAALTEALRADLEQCLARHAQWLMERHTTFQRLSNWGVLQDHGLFLLGLAFGSDEWAATAAARLNEQLHHQVMADGTHWEQSPMYHCEVLHCCLDTLLAARRAGYTLPAAFVKRTHDMAGALAALARPDGLLLCQGDTDEVDARDLLALGALLLADGHLKGRAGGALYPENLWDAADMADTYAGLPAQPPAGSVALPDSGNTMLWDGSGPEAGFLHFSCGVMGSGHGHADTLHLDLVQNGESILADSGRYTYVNSPVRLALKSPAAHNTVRVDGTDFSAADSSWHYSSLAEPIMGRHRFTPAADYVDGGHLGYLALGVVHRRRVLRLGGGLWLWWDSFATADEATPHTYEHHCHFGPEGTASLDKNAMQAVYQGKACSARLAFCGAAAALQLGEAPSSREYNRMEAHPHLTATHTSAGIASFATVAATGPAGQPPALEAEMLPVSLLAAGTALPAHKAQGLRITCAGRQTTVLVCHSEVISEVDLLACGGHSGYGKVLVFSAEAPDGLCLVW